MITYRFKNREQAQAWLEARYDDQVVKYPRLATNISREFYVRRNIKAASKMTVDDEAPAGEQLST